MDKFKEWFASQDFYTNMRFVHGNALFDKDGDFFRILAVQIAWKAWQSRQAEVDDLKAQLNNMEACYIEKKKELEDQHKKVDEVLEYLDGESANRWGLWKEKADMFDQGASNAFEEAYWMAKKVLRGEHE